MLDPEHFESEESYIHSVCIYRNINMYVYRKSICSVCLQCRSLLDNEKKDKWSMAKCNIDGPLERGFLKRQWKWQKIK